MSDRVIQIPIEQLLESLKDGYIEYKRIIEKFPEDKEDIGKVAGYCTTIEQILAAYGNITKNEMLEIKTPIIGEISLRRKQRIQDINLETPTIFRKGKLP